MRRVSCERCQASAAGFGLPLGEPGETCAYCGATVGERTSMDRTTMDVHDHELIDHEPHPVLADDFDDRPTIPNARARTLRPPPIPWRASGFEPLDDRAIEEATRKLAEGDRHEAVLAPLAPEARIDDRGLGTLRPFAGETEVVTPPARRRRNGVLVIAAGALVLAFAFATTRSNHPADHGAEPAANEPAGARPADWADTPHTTTDMPLEAPDEAIDRAPDGEALDPSMWFQSPPIGPQTPSSTDLAPPTGELAPEGSSRP